jgi:Tfp pilus assembly PilM family ATPase
MEGSGDKRVLRAVVQQFIGSVLQTLDFVRAQERASNFRAMLDEIILVGDLADMPGLSSMLGKEVNLPTYSLGQMDLLLGFDADRPKRLSSYGSALALGVRGISA